MEGVKLFPSLRFINMHIRQISKNRKNHVFQLPLSNFRAKTFTTEWPSKKQQMIPTDNNQFVGRSVPIHILLCMD